MNFRKIRFLIASLLLFNSVSTAQELNLQDSLNVLLTQLNKTILPFTGSAPALDDKDLLPFSRFADSKIIALGEATHGTKDFFQMKHRLFKYFVEKHGYKVFGFEADMGECIYIDRFICKEEGTIEEVMAKMHFWTWRTEEVKELILWMKEFNKGKAYAKQIHFLGFDCQFKTYLKDLLLNYLKQNKFPADLKVERILSEINEIRQEQFAKMEQAEVDPHKAKLDSITAYMEQNKKYGAADKIEFEQMKRLVLQARQVLDVAAKKSYLRDKYMAENAEWQSNLYGPETRIILWAHNGHIAKNGMYSNLHGSMGYNLNKKMGANYKAIGFSFNYGSFQAVGMDKATNKTTQLGIHHITETPLENSSNYIFSLAEPKNFLLFMEDTGKFPQLKNWLNRLRLFFSTGAVYSKEMHKSYYYIHNLYFYFDALIHFNNTRTAAAYKITP